MNKLPPDHTLESSDDGQYTVYWRKTLGNFPVCRKTTEQEAVDTAWRLYQMGKPGKTHSVAVAVGKCINDD